MRIGHRLKTGTAKDEDERLQKWEGLQEKKTLYKGKVTEQGRCVWSARVHLAADGQVRFCPASGTCYKAQGEDRIQGRDIGSHWSRGVS